MLIFDTDIPLVLGKVNLYIFRGPASGCFFNGALVSKESSELVQQARHFKIQKIFAFFLWSALGGYLSRRFRRRGARTAAPK